MKGNITKTVERTEIKGLFYNMETKNAEEKTTFVYSGVGEGFDTADAVSQNPGLIEILEVSETVAVTIGMSLDKFFNCHEFEKEKRNKED